MQRVHVIFFPAQQGVSFAFWDLFFTGGGGGNQYSDSYMKGGPPQKKLLPHQDPKIKNSLLPFSKGYWPLGANRVDGARLASSWRFLTHTLSWLGALFMVC